MQSVHIIDRIVFSKKKCEAPIIGTEHTATNINESTLRNNFNIEYLPRTQIYHPFLSTVLVPIGGPSSELHCQETN